jgi:hypothetical protein
MVIETDFGGYKKGVIFDSSEMISQVLRFRDILNHQFQNPEF